VVVSGIYGMNVKGLPGAESEHSLAIVFAVMVVTTAALLWLLKWFRWL
jgi:magnesium transporter